MANLSFSGSLFSLNFTADGPSPFNSSSLTYGSFNPKHTSTATLVYSPQTVPTPWLVLTFSYGYSFISIIWGIIQAFRKGDNWGVRNKRATLRTACTLFNIIYSSYRLIAAVRKAIQSFHDPLIPAQDLYQMEFLAHSLFQYSFVDVFYNAPTRNNLIKVFTSLISLLVVIPAWQSALRVVHKNEQYYSKWQLVGGNCPLPVGSCQHLDYVGCGLNATLGIAPKDVNIIDTANYLRIWEYIGAIGSFAVWSVIFASLPFAVAYGMKQGLDEIKEGQKQAYQSGMRGGDLSENGEGYASLAMYALWGIILQAVPGIVLTVLQEGKPKSIFVVDSFGPVVPTPALLPGQNYTGGNSTSWSDCFEIHAPSDKWGFLAYWVNSTDIVQKLAIL